MNDGRAAMFGRTETELGVAVPVTLSDVGGAGVNVTLGLRKLAPRAGIICRKNAEALGETRCLESRLGTFWGGGFSPP